VISAWTGLKTAGRMVEASAARSIAAAQALRSVQLEAKVGAKPTLAVLDAEREASAADAAAIEAEGQRLIAAWQLNALVGQLTPEGEILCTRTGRRWPRNCRAPSRKCALARPM
jgi:outer membrane protein